MICIKIIGTCFEMNHKDDLDYFCKDHNKLCCSACLSKIKDKGKGQHHDCNVTLLEEIKDEKRNHLNENLKNLEELSNNIENSINELKKIFENVTKSKEELKLRISSIFTRLRNSINEREDEILLEVDNIFDKTYFKEDKIKQIEKLPKQIKQNLEKGKILSENWENNEIKLSSKINDCINIENNIKNIMDIKNNINACNSNEIKYTFIPETEEEINFYLEKIKKFGDINQNSFKFRAGTNYIVTNNGKVATKNKGGNDYNCTIFGDKEIPKNKISKWKIKLNSETKQSWDILIGIGPDNPKDEINFYKKCWSFLSTQSTLILKNSGSIPYFNHSGRLKKGDIVEVIIDRKLGNLFFKVNDVDYGIACSKIPKDDILYPTVSIYDQNLSVEIL